MNDMKELLISGKTYKEACGIMATETVEAMVKFPQWKHELAAAWKELRGYTELPRKR
jgi:hypothetical protein